VAKKGALVTPAGMIAEEGKPTGRMQSEKPGEE
jgi:hypothetical protein